MVRMKMMTGTVAAENIENDDDDSYNIPTLHTIDDSNKITWNNQSKHHKILDEHKVKYTTNNIKSSDND